MRLNGFVVCLAAGLFLAVATHAAPPIETVRKAVKAITNQDVEKLQKFKVPGLYEVHTKSQLFYTDEKGQFVLLGAHVFSTTDSSNHTEKCMSEIAGYKFADLPLRDAIKIVRGNGRRTLVTFEDPNCGYCKQL